MKKWISIAFLGFLLSLFIAIGVAFGFKNKKYFKTSLNFKTKLTMINKVDYEKIKKRKQLELKIDNIVYYAKFKFIKQVNDYCVIKIFLNLKTNEKMIGISIYTNTQPLIKSIINNFKL
ncbi:hypothetical protein [Ureaplasma urealyticum]|nr:hypothetical protein [Ureaplasma urealyticum]EDX53329.1 conserved hypothetical protein [Ureaplasma urealyticum serovar 12 str. ATCC 33696]EDY74689.1 conserved hypothetical protein [Ureaplasma urealyticum serovar 4 str. ATCC 27816]MDU3864541.1 hypothetical protein [Ureaplasma urealyticum]QDI65219.1 hypothetical protein FJM05_02845 [Ureaplasma urealyticum]RCJ00557.1 hypothetical protein DSQ42_02980 [Ureaplasma urealyticum]